jgi:hypothetical protein
MFGLSSLKTYQNIYNHTIKQFFYYNTTMYAPFKTSPTIIALERANDLIQIDNYPDKNTSSNKRSRGHVQQEEADVVFKEIVKELDYAELFPTFRTLVLEQFYVLLSANPEHEYYNSCCNIVVAFRHIIKSSDKLFYSMDTDDRKEIYYYLTDELKRLLYNGQQLILLFHLSANSP